MQPEIDQNSLLFRAAVENSYDLISLLTEDGTVLYESPSIERVLGFKPQEIIGKNAFDLVHPEDLPQLLQEFAVALQQERGEVSPYRSRCANGEWKWLESTGSVLVGSVNPRKVVVNSRDITERKIAEEIQQKTTREIVTIWESMTDALFVIDTQWRFTYVNHQAERVLQAKSQELIGQNIWEKFPAAVGLPFFTNYQRAIGEQTKTEFEAFYPPLESWFEVHAYPSPLGLSVYFRDVSERRQIEQQLRLHSHLLDVVGQAVIVTETDGTITYWNHFAEELYGWSKSEAIGRNIMQVTVPDISSVTAAEIISSLSKGLSWAGEFLVQKRDGTTFPAFVTDTPVFDNSNHISCIIGLSVDITERKQAEEQQQQSQQFLQSTLDALSSHIAVLDEQGEIIMVNAAWRRFALENGGDLLLCGVGANYLEVCDRVRGNHAKEAASAAMGIRSVIADESANFSLEYLCSSRSTLRWFNFCVTRFAGDGPVRVVVAHDDITKRKIAEAERDRFFTLSRDMLSIVDKDGYFKIVNPAFERILGYSEKELMGQPYIEFVHPEDRESTMVEATKIRRDGISTPNFENRYRCRDGSYKWLAWTSVTYEGLSYATARDITAIKEAEAGLESSLALLQATLESTADGILVVDDTGQMTHYNRKFVAMWDIPPEIMRSGDDQTAIHYVQNQLLNAEPFLSKIRELYSDPEAVGTDFLYLKDGRVFERYTQAQRLFDDRIGRVWSFRDVSERHQAEIKQAQFNQELEHQRRRLDEILTNVPGIVWEVTTDPITNEPHTVYVSQYVTTMLGYDPEEWLSISDFWQRIIHLEDLEPVMAQHHAMMESGKDGIFQYRMMTKDGHPVWVESHSAVVRDDQGKVAGFRGVTMDITQRMQALDELNHARDELELRVQERTEELAQTNHALHTEAIERQMAMGALREAIEAHRQAKEEAEEANRAKSDFLSRMSHELRTPLNAILGFGQVLEIQQQNLTARQNGSIQQILKAGRHLLDLINEVLDIARVEAGRIDLSLEPVQLHEIIQESVSLIRPLASRQNILLDGNWEEQPLFYVQADRQRLKQVLINLLSNAIKYNRPDGSVSLTCIIVSPDRIQIRISDTGTGIAPEDRERLFKPFERLLEQGTEIEGTGLGLSLSLRLVEIMNGTLTVESEIGQGSTFTVELPRAINQVQTANPAISQYGNEAEMRHSHVILSIEDNPANFQLIEAIFENRLGLQLLHAENGTRGLELARQNHPDLILLDLHLPDIPGDDILHKLQSAPDTREIPVVVVSADATAPRIQRLMASGARSYLTKPLNVRQFLHTVAKILDEEL